jgi:hypothetical protein
MNDFVRVMVSYAGVDGSVPTHMHGLAQPKNMAHLDFSWIWFQGQWWQWSAAFRLHVHLTPGWDAEALDVA